MPAAASQTNVPELTVSELSGALKRTVEDRFGQVRVRGEISGYRGPHSSGHAYFCLKDEGARLDAVVWKTAFQRMRIKPEDGLEVVATGRITTFPGKSTYQIVIETIESAGLGALMALLEERRRRLAAEGLFAESRKRALPFLPHAIGVVTSPTGSVIRDILHRLGDRFPRRVLVWPVRVQGETCGAEVAAAIAGFNALTLSGAMARPAVIIVARGGGSLEDLWGFNDEAVVRAAAASSIPLISAVGHETDWTLLDHVADRRAPTPTGAAEFAVPVRHDLMAQVADFERRRRNAATRSLDQRRVGLRALARALGDGSALLATPTQRADRAGERLRGMAVSGLHARQREIGRLAALLVRHTPRAELARTRERLRAVSARLERAGRLPAADARRRLAAAAARLPNAAGRLAVRADQQREAAERAGAALLRAYSAGLARRDQAAEHAWKLLGTLGYRAVLQRGFALVRDATGQTVRTAAAVSPGATLALEFADGHVEVHAGGRIGRRPGARAARAESPLQGRLF